VGLGDGPLVGGGGGVPSPPFVLPLFVSLPFVLPPHHGMLSSLHAIVVVVVACHHCHCCCLLPSSSCSAGSVLCHRWAPGSGVSKQ